MRNPELGTTITPKPNSTVCEKARCEETDLLALVDPDRREESRVLCPRHRVLYLREVHSK